MNLDYSELAGAQRLDFPKVSSQLEFVAPSAVSGPNGSPAHPRLQAHSTQTNRIVVFDAAHAGQLSSPFLHGTLTIDNGDAEFLSGGALGPRVASILRKLCSPDVLKRDFASDPVFPSTNGSQAVNDSPAEAPPNASSMEAVQRQLAHATSSDIAADELSRAFCGKVLRLRGGWMLIVHCPRMGIIRRAVYPKNGHPPDSPSGASIHADQDVQGDPLKERSWILRWLLDNRWLRILNVWMPVGHMAARPLCAMDTRSLRPEHQVRHRWLEHDGWYFLHHPEQRWWWHSTLGADVGDAVLFDTLRSPHAAFPLPDEDQCHELRERLRACLEMNDIQGALVALRSVHPPLGGWTIPVARALAAAEAELAEAAPGDKECVRRALGFLQRQSIEARIVAVGPISSRALCLTLACMAAAIVASLRQKIFRF